MNETNNIMLKKDLVFTRVFEVPVEEVWKAWVEPSLVMQWWGPDGFTSPLAEIDFQEGKISLVCMSAPEYGDLYNTWLYKSIVPEQRIEFIQNLSNEKGENIDPTSVGMPADFPQDVRTLVTFKDLGDGKTELTVTEYDWPVGQMMEMSRMGMEQCLNKMAALLAKT